MAVPGPKFHKVKSFQHFFRKFLVSLAQRHFPETVYPSWTRRERSGILNKPICAPNQMNGPPRAGADRVSDRQAPYGIFFSLKRSDIWSKISRKADRESSYDRFISVKPIGLLLFSSIIIITYFFIKINRSVPGGPIGNFSLLFLLYQKKYILSRAARTLDFYKKICYNIYTIKE